MLVGGMNLLRGRLPAPTRRVPAEEEACAGLFNSGEQMHAGGGCVAGGCTPAKPRWSEVIIFWASVLRRETAARRKPAVLKS